MDTLLWFLLTLLAVANGRFPLEDPEETESGPESNPYG